MWFKPKEENRQEYYRCPPADQIEDVTLGNSVREPVVFDRLLEGNGAPSSVYLVHFRLQAAAKWASGGAVDYPAVGVLGVWYTSVN